MPTFAGGVVARLATDADKVFLSISASIRQKETVTYANFAWDEFEF